MSIHDDSSNAPPGAPRTEWEATYREGTWDYLASLEEMPRFAVVAGYVRRLPGGTVLDAGCGEGVLIDHLDLDRIRYTGLDISATAIDRARRRRGDLPWHARSLEEFIDANAERYDIIIFNEVLSVLDDPIETFHRYCAALRPGGHIIISQFQGTGPTSNARLFAAKLENEIADERYVRVGAAEIRDVAGGRAWKVFCLRVRPADEV